MLSACYPTRGATKKNPVSLKMLRFDCHTYYMSFLWLFSRSIFSGFFSRDSPSKWCYHLYMFITLSLLVFSSALSNALCFCLFIQQQITNIYVFVCYALHTRLCFSASNFFSPFFFAIASKLHLWFYHCRHKFKSLERMSIRLFNSLNSHDLWEPFSNS